MGVAGGQTQGLHIKTVDVKYKGVKKRLTRLTEVGVLTDFGVPQDVAASIRTNDLRIAMQFRPSHQVIEVSFTAAKKGTLPGNLPAWIELDEEPAVSRAARDVFGPEGQWVGLIIDHTQIPNSPWPTASPPYPAIDDRLYFRVILENFTLPHPMDAQVLPVAVTLANDFRTQFAMGVGLFTRGLAKKAIQFDTQVIATYP